MSFLKVSIQRCASFGIRRTAMGAATVVLALSTLSGLAQSPRVPSVPGQPTQNSKQQLRSLKRQIKGQIKQQRKLAKQVEKAEMQALIDPDGVGKVVQIPVQDAVKEWQDSVKSIEDTLNRQKELTRDIVNGVDR